LYKAACNALELFLGRPLLIDFRSKTFCPSLTAYRQQPIHEANEILLTSDHIKSVSVITFLILDKKSSFGTLVNYIFGENMKYDNKCTIIACLVLCVGCPTEEAKPNCGRRVVPAGYTCYQEFRSSPSLVRAFESLTTGDIDGNGFDDVIMGGGTGATDGDSITNMILNSGDGINFTAAVLTSNGQEPLFKTRDIRVFDVDQDQQQDIFQIRNNSQTVSNFFVLKNDNFDFSINQEIVSPKIGFSSLSIGDFNQDNFSDVIAINQVIDLGPGVFKELHPDIDIYKNVDGLFVLEQEITHPVGDVFGKVTFGDMDGDKFLDIVATRTGLSGDVFVDIFVNKDNVFELSESIKIPFSGIPASNIFPVFVGALEVSDLNNDFISDIVLSVIDGRDEKLLLLTQEENGTFSERTIFKLDSFVSGISPQPQIKILKIDNFDIDERKDIATTISFQDFIPKNIVIFHSESSSFIQDVIFTFDFDEKSDFDAIAGEFNGDKVCDFFIINFNVNKTLLSGTIIK
jgi:hypothetical protein